jgi:S-layer homology domain
MRRREMPVRVRIFLLGLLLAVVLAAAVAAPAFAAWFEDTDGHPYETSILALADRGIVSGFDPDHFGPDDPVIRQQFAKMIVLTLGLTVSEDDWQDTAKPFRDLDSDDLTKLYPHEYVAVCARNNITKGTQDPTKFAPYLNITRQQVITMVVRAADNLTPGSLEAVPAGWNGVLDYSDPTHGSNIKKAEFNGLLKGIWASTTIPIQGLAGWDTSKNATRGEVAEILAQLLYRSGTILTLKGPTGTQELTMADLKALQAVDGFGGWKNRIDIVYGPWALKGVSIKTLANLVGGGSEVTVKASDGYKLAFDLTTYSDDANGALVMWDPVTKLPVADIDGELSMVLVYALEGGPLPSDWGALRVGFISPADDQVTYSGKWVSQVAGLEFK